MSCGKCSPTIPLCLACLVSPGGAARGQDGDEQSNDPLRSLPTERRDVLQERLAVVQQMFQQGRVEIEKVIAARNAVLESELALSLNAPANSIADSHGALGWFRASRWGLFQGQAI